MILVTILLLTLLGLVPPLLLPSVFDDAIQKGNVRLLFIYVAIMGVAFLLSGIISLVQGYVNDKVGQNVMYDLRNQLYNHLQSMPLSFFTGTRTGEIQSRLSNDIGGVQGAVTNTIINLISNISESLTMIIAMIVISPLLTLITFGTVPVFMWITYKVSNVRRQTSKETQKTLA